MESRAAAPQRCRELEMSASAQCQLGNADYRHCSSIKRTRLAGLVPQVFVADPNKHARFASTKTTGRAKCISGLIKLKPTQATTGNNGLVRSHCRFHRFGPVCDGQPCASQCKYETRPSETIVPRTRTTMYLIWVFASNSAGRASL